MCIRDSAERVGYKECKTADEFDAWWNKFDDKGIAKFVKDQEAKNPGSGEKILADFKTKGWTTVNKKTVSYTHLDVYKRQAVAFAVGNGVDAVDLNGGGGGVVAHVGCLFLRKG